MSEKKVFTFLRSFYDAAKLIPDKDVRADFFMAICSYSLDGEVPELDGYAAVSFALCKPVIDSNIAKARRKEASNSEVTAEILPSNSEVTAKLLPSDYEVTLSNRSNELKSNDKRSNDITPLPPKVNKTGFDEFWSAYPKKVGKESAKKAFQKVKEPLETLLSAIERQKCSDQWSKDNGQYIPNPATWLNQGRWEDELPQKRGSYVDAHVDLSDLDKLVGKI